MNRWTFIYRSLWFYRRTHLGVLLTASLAAAVLTGALAVGDSVHDSLRNQPASRLGKVQLALAPQAAFFRTDLAAAIGRDLGAPTAAALELPASASLPDSTARANQVSVLGVDDDFYKLSPDGAGPAITPGQVVLNQSLAIQLHAQPGQSIILRIEKPSLLPRDAPLSSDHPDEVSFSANLVVSAIATPGQFGRFSRQPSQSPTPIAFVPRAWLQAKANQPGRANLLLTASPDLPAAQAALAAKWQLADAGLELRQLPALDSIELRSSAIFLPPAVSRAAAGTQPGATGILTYFVNQLRTDEKTTPYSFVTAIGPLAAAQTLPAASSAPIGGIEEIPAGDIIINDWLAADLDLQGKPANIELTYYVLGPMRELLTRKSTFHYAGRTAMTGLAADRELMPPFPGLADTEECRDWDAGVPIDFAQIRPEDEQYWRDHRGTPKAFISLADGQSIWGNRFGNLTAIRWPAAPGRRATVESRLRSAIDPRELGFVWQDIRPGASAATATTDFAGLFLGLSIFLVVAALLLTGLLFSFAIRQRTAETGTMLALGLSPRQVRNLMIGEALTLSAAGSAIGALAGLGYTALMLAGLRTLWSGAVAGASVTLSVHATTLAIGFLAGTVIAACTMYLVLRRQCSQPARALLAGDDSWHGHLAPAVSSSFSSSSCFLKWRGRLAHAFPSRFTPAITLISAFIAVAGAVVLAALSPGRSDPNSAGTFFASGSLLLIAGLLATRWALHALAHRRGMTRPATLALRNVTCRPMRSLATVGLLACGTFLVVAVGANRHDPAADSDRPSSGTGGFALIAHSSLPILRDLNDPAAQAAFGLAGKLDSVRFVPLRVRPGAQADCLNLNRVSQPQLLGVDSAHISARGSFTFVAAAPGLDLSARWQLLDLKTDDSTIPAIADENTVVWSLGKKPGDTLDYIDDAGHPLRLRIVGVIANSILQGSVLISQDNFLRHFGSQPGARMLLIDCPSDRSPAVAALLTRQLWSQGLQASPAWRRLADLDEVENTYLTIFQALGGLGLLLGSAGLALVVLRNVLERRAELALMRAIGFSRRRLAAMVLAEHAFLLAAGLVIGLVSAAVAVFPAIASAGASVPYLSLALTLLAVLLNGLVWIHLASTWSLRGNLIQALRNE